MHVLFLPKWYPGRKDPQLGDFLRKQGIAVAQHAQVSVLCALPVQETERAYEQELVEANGLWELRVYYRSSTHALKPLRKLLNLLRYWRAMNQGWQRLLAERGLPQVLHVHILVRPALFAWRKGARHGIPYLISEQSSEYLDGTYAGKGRLFHALNRGLFRKAAGITVVSAWLGDALVRLGLCRSYAVVPNVVPGLERALPPAGTPGHYLMVADLVDRTKNVSGVLRALAQASEHNAALQLRIIGDGPDRAQLEGLCDALGLRDRVRFLGRLPNSAVLDHMAGAFAVIINSNVETFSVVTGEALAQGKPVIATRCGGPIAFLSPANGLLIPVGDEAALQQAMLQLVEQAGQYRPDTIRASVSERFSYAAVGAAFVKEYQHILQRDA